MHPILDKAKVKTTMRWLEPYPDIPSMIALGIAGKMHYGYDFAPCMECKNQCIFIIAPVSGKVIQADTYWFDDDKHPFGNLIKIESNSSDRGNIHYLAHLERIFVQEGHNVKKGQVIALMGNTGCSSAKHTHYGVKNPNLEWIDPKIYLT